jgi:putative transcriptional regulator
MYNRIRELRAGAGLSQQELALRVGVRRETIVFLEKAKYNPSLRLAHDIARVFGLSIEEVFRFDEAAGGGPGSGDPGV